MQVKRSDELSAAQNGTSVQPDALCGKEIPHVVDFGSCSAGCGNQKEDQVF